jgi:hypothetical protein
MLFVRPVERPPTHMQLRIAAPGPPVDLRKAQRAKTADNWEAVRKAQRAKAAANWEAVRKQAAADEQAALHERYRQEDMLACALKSLGMHDLKFASDPKSKAQMWAEFERCVTRAPVPAVEPFVERMLCSEPLIYKNNIFDNSFVYGSRVCDETQRATGAAVRAAVVEVD